MQEIFEPRLLSGQHIKVLAVFGVGTWDVVGLGIRGIGSPGLLSPVCDPSIQLRAACLSRPGD